MPSSAEADPIPGPIVAVADYGMGNCAAVVNMARRIGVEAQRVTDPWRLVHARRIILPGVGSFNTGMAQLNRFGFRQALEEAVRVASVPVLGICLGMQLFSEGSDEGPGDGLGWIRGRCRRLQPAGEYAGLPVPHMAWAPVQNVRGEPMLDGIPDGPRFYFVHSFWLDTPDSEVVTATCDYGVRFPAIIRKGNIVGVQFHPEKSLRWGMHVLRKFVEHG